MYKEIFLSGYGALDLLYAQETMWMASEDGKLVSWGKAGKLDVYDPGRGGKLRSITADREGQIWIARQGGSVLRLFRDPWKLIVGPGARQLTVDRICPDGNQLLIADREGIAWRYTGLQQRAEILSPEGANIRMTDFLRLDKDHVIMLSEDGGIYLLKGQARIPEFVFQLDSTQQWKAIRRGQNGNIWLLSDHDLYRASFGSIPGLSVSECAWQGTSPLEDILIDRQNRAWWHTGNRIGWYENGRFTDLKVPGFMEGITNWHEDDEGSLWIGTAGSGLFRVDLEAVPLALDIIRNIQNQAWPVIHNIFRAGKERLLVTTEHEIQYWDIDPGTQQITGVRYTQNIDQEGGLAFIPGTLGKLQNGRFVAGTSKGVLQINPGEHTVRVLPHTPAAVIDLVEVNDQPIYKTGYRLQVGPWNSQRGAISFGPDENDLRFGFSAAQYHRHDRVLYRWRLLGSIDEWSAPSSQTGVSFPNLSPGSYRFEVKACSGEPGCQGQAASFSFTIAAHWYQTWWFYTALAMIAVLLLGLVISLRDRRKEKDFRAAREKMRLENRALDLQRKALQLQMNPHFLFNAMNTIQSEIKAESLVEAKLHLAKFARLMRQVLESSRAESTTLEEEIELLDNYVAIASLSKGMTVTFEVHTDGDLEPEMIEMPAMMLQPFVENAIQHGFSGLDQGKIEMNVSLKGRNLHIELLDDGHGFKERNGEKSGSVALRVIRERLQMMKPPGHFGIRPLDPDAEERKGTIVSLKLPLI